MGRKRRDEDQVPEQTEETGQTTDPGDEPKPRRRGRKLALLLALAGAATYVVRRNQRKAELDEGIWHEAPAPEAPTNSTPGAATTTPDTPTTPTATT